MGFFLVKGRKSDIFHGALRCEVTLSEFSLLKCEVEQKQHGPFALVAFFADPVLSHLGKLELSEDGRLTLISF